MNGEQQRTHKTAIEELAKSVDTIMGKFARDTQHGFNQMAADVKEECRLRTDADQFLTDRIQAHQNEIEALQKATGTHYRRLTRTLGHFGVTFSEDSDLVIIAPTGLMARPFWGRMRWLLTGK